MPFIFFRLMVGFQFPSSLEGKSGDLIQPRTILK